MKNNDLYAEYPICIENAVESDRSKGVVSVGLSSRCLVTILLDLGVIPVPIEFGFIVGSQSVVVRCVSGTDSAASESRRNDVGNFETSFKSGLITPRSTIFAGALRPRLCAVRAKRLRDTPHAPQSVG